MRIVRVTAIAVVLATALDLGIEAFVRQTLAVSRDFEPFQGTVGPYTVGGVILAGVAFALVRRVLRWSVQTYVWIAVVALVLSWIPDVVLLVAHDPGATVPAVGALMVMHAVAAAIAVGTLVRFANES